MQNKTEKFNAGDQLIWTRSNGTTEPVRFKSYAKAPVAVTPGGSAFPDKPTATAIVIGKNNKDITVPIAELSKSPIMAKS